jgi:ubiquinone/menaquinone biosynthesis C-methylase UbiE
MPISFEHTKTRYRGRKAETYELVRSGQQRWKMENEAVARYMEGAKGTVLDVPVGTGRFIPLWRKLGLDFRGVDSSEQMLELARKKMGSKQRGYHSPLKVGDAADLEYEDRTFDSVACIRFLDLIPEEGMLKVLRELCRVARDRVVLTIRLGETYVHKSNTCTHDRRKFYRAVRRHGWEIDHATPIFRQGWEVMRLKRQ